MKAYLLVMMLAVVPWYVHVTALPTLFLEQSQVGMSASQLMIRGVVFMVFAGMLVPILGCFSIFTIGLVVVAAITGFLGRTPVSSAWTHAPSSDAVLRNELFWLLIVGLAGFAIGAVLHALRRDDEGQQATSDAIAASKQGQPRGRSDMLGGAPAAVLALGGVFVTSPIGLFSRPVVIPGYDDWLHRLMATPRIATLVMIGTVALLPHLVMIGIDQRKR